MSTHGNFVRDLNENLVNVGLGEEVKLQLNIPNPFQVTREDKEQIRGILYDGTKIIQPSRIRHSFNLIGDNLWDIMRDVDNIHFYRICTYIASRIDFGNNWIQLSFERIKGYLSKEISSRDYYNVINKLIEYNVICKTNIQKLYCVNPLYIYKGNLLIYHKRIENELKNPIVTKDNIVIVDKYKIFKDKDDIKGTLYVDKSMYAKEVQEVEEIIEEDINYENNKCNNLKLHDEMVEEVIGKRSRRRVKQVINKNGIILKI